MYKINSAIYELLRHVKSDILICVTGNLHIEGQVHRCDWEEGTDECYSDIVTLKNATVTSKGDEPRHYEWINIPAHLINAFAFKCCKREVE